MGFDGASGQPQPGVAQPMQSRPPNMPPSMGGGPPGHGPPPQHMGVPYGNGGPYGMPPQSPHSHNLNGGGNYQTAGPVGAPQYNNPHVPLHSPANMHPGMQQQQQPPMHRQMQQQQQGRPQHGMPPPPQQMPLHQQQPPMNHARQGPPPQQQQQQYMQNPNVSQQQQQQPPGGSSATINITGGWQSDADIPHRREMIQQSKYFIT
jgi:hypothetical protein